MRCRPSGKLSIQIVAAEGDFVWIVKDNQANTRAAIERLFAPERPAPVLVVHPWIFAARKRRKSKPDGWKNAPYRQQSVERLSGLASSRASLSNWNGRFTYLSSGLVETEVQYGLTSLTAQKADPKRLLKIIRSEWGIENGLHYRRDVTFQEDQTRMTVKEWVGLWRRSIIWSSV